MGNPTDRRALAALIPGLAMVGVGLLAYHSDKVQRRREREAFDNLDTNNLTSRQLWDKALEFGRKERLDLRTELSQANKILDRANEMCEINEGMRKCIALLADDSVARGVKEPILHYWMKKFFATFGSHNEEMIDAAFGDEKTIERIGKLEAAQEQYEARISEWKELYDKDIDGDKRHCSFCGKADNEIKQLIAGPRVHICNECVDLCGEIMKESRGRKT